MKQWPKVLAGSIATYLLVAACAAETHSDGFKTAVDAGLDAMGLDAVADVLGLDGGEKPGEDGATVADDSGSIVNPVPEAKAKSGSRLKAYKDVGADGSENYLGTFFDSQRNEDCSFAVAGDGRVRCVPTSATISFLSAFSDSQCTAALTSDSFASGDLPKYASIQSSQALSRTNMGGRNFAGVGSTYFPITSQFNGTVYLKSGATCQPAGAAYAAYRFFSYSNTQVPNGAFAEATTQRDP